MTKRTQKTQKKPKPHCHQHTCAHASVTFCSDCNRVYCADCNQEWVTPSTSPWRLSYTDGTNWPTSTYLGHSAPPALAGAVGTSIVRSGAIGLATAGLAESGVICGHTHDTAGNPLQ